MIVKRIKLHQILTGRAAAFYRVSLLVLFLAMFLAPQAWSETCLSSGDMDAATRTALETAGKRYSDMAARGDVASLRQNAIPSLANDFSGVEAAVKDNQTSFAGAQGTPRPPFLLKEQAPSAATATGPVPGRHGERRPALGDDVSSNGDGSELKLDLAPVRRDTPKVGRNEPCPCGSGKKYKNCHGSID